MSIRQIIAAALLLLGIFLLWQGIAPVAMLTARGSGLSDALLQPPSSLIRILAAALVAIGGALALAKRAGGAVMALIGTALFAALAGLLVAASPDASLWGDELIAAALLCALSAGLIFTRRAA
jgi:hypothetical protein